MKRLISITSALLLVGGLGGAVASRIWFAAPCGQLTEDDKVQLTKIVRTQYNLPVGAKVGVADAGVANGSCFRKLVFATLSGAPFRAELFLSPDSRFLTKELLEIRRDPKAEAEKRRETAESLVRGKAPSQGQLSAPATLVIFSDFQCPYCAQMAALVKGLAASEGDKIRVVYRYFPLSMHPWARPAAEAAACAQRQSDVAFWSLHDFLFAHQTELSLNTLGKRMSQWESTIDIDRGSFEKCVGESLTAGQIEQDIALGGELGVASTPTVFLNGEPVSEPSSELATLVHRAASGN